MKLTTRAALNVAAGLRALDGYERTAKDGDRERVIKEFYKIGGGLRLSIAVSLNKLDALQQAQQQAYSGLAMAAADDKGQIPPEKVAELAKTQNEMLDAEQDIDLGVIDPADLKLDENPIPVTVLSLIQPILKG